MTGIGNLLELMKNAKQLMEKTKTAQAELAKVTRDGDAGAGIVTATVNGLGELVGLKLEKTAMESGDPEMLADLVIAAVADARRKAEEVRADTVKEAAGGVNLSALGLDLTGLLK